MPGSLPAGLAGWLHVFMHYAYPYLIASRIPPGLGPGGSCLVSLCLILSLLNRQDPGHVII